MSPILLKCKHFSPFVSVCKQSKYNQSKEKRNFSSETIYFITILKTLKTNELESVTVYSHERSYAAKGILQLTEYTSLQKLRNMVLKAHYNKKTPTIKCILYLSEPSCLFM